MHYVSMVRINAELSSLRSIETGRFAVVGKLSTSHLGSKAKHECAMLYTMETSLNFCAHRLKRFFELEVEKSIKIEKSDYNSIITQQCAFMQHSQCDLV